MNFPASRLGDRYQGADDTTYIVAQTDDDGYPYLIWDDHLLDAPNLTDWDGDCWEEVEAQNGPLRPIGQDQRMTDVVVAYADRRREIAEVTDTVPATQHRELYNTVWSINRCTDRLNDDTGPASRQQYAEMRTQQERRLVEILGSPDAAAKLLGRPVTV